ncbi:MAG: hypothetical protein ACE366_16600 [Bradymonadia bacterium]
MPSKRGTEAASQSGADQSGVMEEGQGGLARPLGGLKALDGLQATAKVRLVHLGLGTITINMPIGAKQQAFRQVEVGPFGVTPELTVKQARNLIKAYTKQWPDGRAVLPTLDVIPPAKPKDVPSKAYFDHKGQRIETCYYTKGTDYDGYVTREGEQIHHSVFQAQHFIMSRQSNDAIKRFVEEFDSRPPVLHFSVLIRDQRNEERMASLGMSSRKGSAVS